VHYTGQVAKVSALEAKRTGRETRGVYRGTNSNGERIMTATILEAAVERATMRAGERFVQDAIEAAKAASRVVPMTREQRDFFIDGYIFGAVANETRQLYSRQGRS
jgi:hypothetical protein